MSDTTYEPNRAANGQHAFKLDYARVKGWGFAPLTQQYGPQDVLRHARGLGLGMPSHNADEARFLAQDATLEALPTLAVVLNQGPLWTQDPRTGIDWTKTVHAEESVTLHRPLPTAACVTSTHRVDEIYDKGARVGALMYERKLLALEDGEPLATVLIATLLRGNGGFGVQTGAAPRPDAMPDDRAPDATLELAAPARDNTIYQLGAEFRDALQGHADPTAKPILRGACAIGVAGRAILKLTCRNEPARLRHLRVRYTAPLLADETLRTELWFLEAGRVAFRVRSLERDVVIMNHGLAELIEPER